MSESLLRLVGWSAYANAVLSLANMVTISLFFAAGGFWGPVNDAVSVFWMLSFLPLALLLARVNGAVMGRGAAEGAAIAGAVAMVAFAVLQALLVLGQVRFEQTFAAVVALGGVLGLWLLANGLLALRGATLPAGLAWLSIGFGLSYVVGVVGFWLGGYEHPLLWLGAAVGFVLGPVWAFWLGRLVLRGHLVSVV